jgi:hypothetical protein
MPAEKRSAKLKRKKYIKSRYYNIFNAGSLLRDVEKDNVTKKTENE